jgi:hypothetical protein
LNNQLVVSTQIPDIQGGDALVFGSSQLWHCFYSIEQLLGNRIVTAMVPVSHVLLAQRVVWVGGFFVSKMAGD